VTTPGQGIFREAAIDRLSSPDQLDQLAGVARPIDWAAAAIIGVVLAILLLWSVLGRVSTRVAGDGILIGEAGHVAEATAAAGGRLNAVSVAVGDVVRAGQPIARLGQADLDERRRAAEAAVQDRQAEYADLAAADVRDARAEDASDAARKAGLGQALAAAQDHAGALSRNVKTTEGLVGQGLANQPDLDQLRADLAAARQRAIDDHNAVLALDAERLDRQARRTREELDAQHRVDAARREAGQLAGTLGRESVVVSPVAGRVTEIKAAAGGYLASGAPVAVIETDQDRLQAVVYLPADAGKQVRPGLLARVEPATARRDEYGAVLGQVASISPFPSTPEGMIAVLHNADLVARFSHGGAPYAAIVRLETDPRAPSGYRWSSGRGPGLRLGAGTLAHVEVTVRDRRPIELLLPLLRRVSGADR
jgi:HlyD family secretion protein